jgi:hypothetical protein
MATYTPTTNFGAKDSLPSNDPNKVVKGAEFTDEFEAISTVFGGVAPTLNPVFTGTVTAEGISASSITLTGNASAADVTASGNITATGNVTAAGNVTATGNVSATDVTYTGSLNGPDGALATEPYVIAQIDAAVLAPITGLDALADVNVSGVTDGQTIIWDAANSEWVPLAGNLFLDVDATSVTANSFVETHSVTTGVLDCSVSNVFSAVLTAPVTFSFTNVPAVDGAYACTLDLTAAGNAVTWPTGVVWPTATPPVLSAGRDVFVFFTRDAGTTWNGFVAGQEMG